MKVELIPHVVDRWTGNILWKEKFPIKDGAFPVGFPVTNEMLYEFRSRGYLASCFPEGDGITFTYKDKRHWKDVKKDVEECFGFEIEINFYVMEKLKALENMK